MINTTTPTRNFLTAKYDKVFKAVMLNPNNEDLLKEFISRLLKRNVNDIELLSSEVPVDNVDDKNMILDLFLKVDNEYTHLELNISDPEYLHNRTISQFNRYYNQIILNKDGNYKNIPKCYIYNLVYGMLKSRKTNEIEKIYQLVDVNNSQPYVDFLEIHEYDMDMVTKLWYDNDIEKVNELKHLIMLDLEPSELDKLSKGDDLVSEFEDKVVTLNADKDFVNKVYDEIDACMIKNTEIIIAEENGSKNKQKEIAKNMLKKDLDIALISEMTGLTTSEIESLRSNL